MTTEELADSLGVARQTVNRWIRQKGWKTEGINGVKGGRARVICIDAHVKEHIISLPAIRNRRAVYHVAESPSHYGVATSSSLLPQIIDSLENMTTMSNRNVCTSCSLVKGCRVFSRVLVLLNNRHKKTAGYPAVFCITRALLLAFALSNKVQGFVDTRNAT